MTACWAMLRFFTGTKQPACDLVSTATVMFRHGAAPDPWLNTVLAEL